MGDTVVITDGMLKAIYDMACETHAEQKELARVYHMLSKRHRYADAAQEALSIAMWADAALSERHRGTE